MNRPRRPRRAVAHAQLAPHTSILMRPSHLVKTHFWRLTLECGHEVERWIRWLPRPDGRRARGFAAFAPSLSRLPDPPKYAFCEACL